MIDFLTEIKIFIIHLQVKIPCKPNDTLSDAQMSQFLQTLCRTCNSCENLITLDPGPEQCEKCTAEEQKELLLEQQEENKQNKRESIKQEALKKTFKYETESDSSNSDRPLKYTIKRVKNEYKFDIDNDNDNDLTIGVSDIESTEDQEENVTSTTAAAITTTTTTTTSTTITTGSTSQTFTGPTVQSSEESRPPPTGPPQEWSVEDVIRFISDTDSALAVHADLFRKHVRFANFFS